MALLFTITILFTLKYRTLDIPFTKMKCFAVYKSRDLFAQRLVMIFTRSILPKKTHSDNHTNGNNFKLVLVHNSVPLGYTHSQKSFGFLCSSFKLDRHFDSSYTGSYSQLIDSKMKQIPSCCLSLCILMYNQIFLQNISEATVRFLVISRTHSFSYLNDDSLFLLLQINFYLFFKPLYSIFIYHYIWGASSHPENN